MYAAAGYAIPFKFELRSIADRMRWHVGMLMRCFMAFRGWRAMKPTRSARALAGDQGFRSFSASAGGGRKRKRRAPSA